ncbi:M56 family metallopeptidase [Pseudoalteromonas denitrificans]|uniref:Signal transducer regulating beta-lactamase production, contains metallopeptidase domain n=1 Tax=Pseudoalteromonas denitrificans DSM 6059 TaxID=1123010 RepID=A0A1I1MC69_9GAMM|nr:M56 family metallopeptidase [Pseudoalteromonas denitrificans]SFC82964.1 Signal transducer regulating beta-lactamase production, contains metallopeptidase domain [Pseudoalteromonas denitrificans DSM 6059]
MLFFLISNAIITTLVLVLNRFSHQSINIKLFLSVFSLTCWLFPFTMIRDILAKNISIDIPWTTSTVTSMTPNIVTPVDLSLMPKVSLDQIIMILALIGALFFMIRVYKYNVWVNAIKNSPNVKFITKYRNIPVYTSNQIHNAILMGYKKPSIWLNPSLIDSAYYDMILEHEATHVKHRDNYMISFMTCIRAIYWWNPLIYILTNNLKDLIEARCDQKSSEYFTEGIYQKKLIALILLNTPVSQTGFSSAVISKNSNIRRLKLFKEKQTMSSFSKSMTLLFITLVISILTIPISTFNAAAHSSKNIEQYTGAQVELEITINQTKSTNNAVKGNWVSETTLWSEFSKITVLKLKERWRVEFITNQVDGHLEVNFLITDLDGGNLTPYPMSMLMRSGQSASMYIENEEGLSIELKLEAEFAKKPVT